MTSIGFRGANYRPIPAPANFQGRKPSTASNTAHPGQAVHFGGGGGMGGTIFASVAACFVIGFTPLLHVLAGSGSVSTANGDTIASVTKGANEAHVFDRAGIFESFGPSVAINEHGDRSDFSTHRSFTCHGDAQGNVLDGNGHQLGKVQQDADGNDTVLSSTGEKRGTVDGSSEGLNQAQKAGAACELFPTA